LRHESLETTQVYIQKMYPWEKMRQDFDAKRNSPFVPETSHGLLGNGCAEHKTVFSESVRGGKSICGNCSILSVCKYAPLPSCVEGCRFKVKEEQKI
jgi:hypothetical protein